MAGLVCVDASFALRFLSDDPEAIERWRSWRDDRLSVVAPPLFFAEVVTVIREQVYFKHRSPGDGQDALDAFEALPVSQVDPPGLHRRAWDLAARHNRPRAYDAQYVAVAQLGGCELWTADRRLKNGFGYPWIQVI